MVPQSDTKDTESVKSGAKRAENGGEDTKLEGNQEDEVEIVGTADECEEGQPGREK
jgi:hypothetical protein